MKQNAFNFFFQLNNPRKILARELILVQVVFLIALLIFGFIKLEVWYYKNEASNCQQKIGKLKDFEESISKQKGIITCFNFFFNKTFKWAKIKEISRNLVIDNKWNFSNSMEFRANDNRKKRINALYAEFAENPEAVKNSPYKTEDDFRAAFKDPAKKDEIYWHLSKEFNLSSTEFGSIYEEVKILNNNDLFEYLELKLYYTPESFSNFVRNWPLFESEENLEKKCAENAGSISQIKSQIDFYEFKSKALEIDGFDIALYWFYILAGFGFIFRYWIYFCRWCYFVFKK